MFSHTSHSFLESHCRVSSSKVLCLTDLKKIRITIIMSIHYSIRDYNYYCQETSNENFKRSGVYYLIFLVLMSTWRLRKVLDCFDQPLQMCCKNKDIFTSTTTHIKVHFQNTLYRCHFEPLGKITYRSHIPCTWVETIET